MEKKPKEYALEYAGFWIRFGAGVIDILVLLGIYCIVLNFVSWMTISFSSASALVLPGSSFTLLIQRLLLNPFIWTVMWFLKVAYFVGFWTWRGQTPGKMVLGIKVIRTDSSPITLGYAFLRYLGYIVSAMTLYIGFIWIAFDSRKQGLHDKIADTYVVKLPVRQVILTRTYARTGAGLA